VERGSRRRAWAVAVTGWSLVFAAPHLYWAAGGRAGLGAEASAADAALASGWFLGYDLSAAALAVAGAALAWWLVRSDDVPGSRADRWLHRLLLVAAVVLLVRGAVGVVLLLTSPGDDPGSSTPAILVAVEPWFLLGAVCYGGLWRALRPRPARSRPGAGGGRRSR
jgi:succinate dehydrogenase hydrophobic anchor subunit